MKSSDIQGETKIPQSRAVRDTLAEAGRTMMAGAVVSAFCFLIFDANPRYFWIDDNQESHLPCFRELASGWSEGVPIVSPASWFAGALGGEVQNGVFSIFESLLSIVIWQFELSLPATAATISITYLAILGCGAFRLARRRGLETALAMMVAIVAALNGWFFCWGAKTWITNLSALAWLPWAWWALEASLASRHNRHWFVLPAGIFIYLIAAAGSPWTGLIFALHAVWLGLRTIFREGYRAPVPLLAAGTLGLGLSIPTILMFLELYLNGARVVSGDATSRLSMWVVPPQGFLGLLLPAYPTPAWSTFRGEPMHASIELACGLVPPIATLLAVCRLGWTFLRKIAWDLLLLISVGVIAASPGFSNFSFSFRWLPLFHLALALIGATALSELYRTESEATENTSESTTRKFPALVARCTRVPGVLGLVSFFAIGAIMFLAFHIHPGFKDARLYAAYGKPVLQLGKILMAVSFGWFLADIVARYIRALRPWIPSAVALISLWFTYTNLQTIFVVHWDMPEEMRLKGKLDSQTTYLSLHSNYDFFQLRRENFGTLIRIGNTPMYAGLRFVHGYSSVRLAGQERVFGFENQGYLPFRRAREITHKNSGPKGLLELMGVDGLVVGNSLASQIPTLLANGWIWIDSGGDGFVMHRAGHQSPRIRTVDTVETVPDEDEAISRVRNTANVPLTLVDKNIPKAKAVSYSRSVDVSATHESQTRVTASVKNHSTDKNALLVFSRPWYPGYKAWMNGTRVPVKVINLMLPAVEVPAGVEGELVLQYLPNSLIIGLISSGITLVTAVAIMCAGIRRRRKRHNLTL